MGTPCKLSDKDKKRIIADRVNGAAYREIADKYHVSVTTIKRVCDADPDTAKRVTEKKEQNTMDMLAFLDSQKGRVQVLLEHIVEAMDNQDKLNRTNPRDLATALGIIIDKYLGNAPKNAQHVEDDGFLKALKSTAAEDWKNGNAEQ